MVLHMMAAVVLKLIITIAFVAANDLTWDRMAPVTMQVAPLGEHLTAAMTGRIIDPEWQVANPRQSP